MRKYVDCTSKTNEIRLLLKHPSHKNNLFIVLEGETDIRLFRSLLTRDRVSLESVDGKADLLRVVQALRQDALPIIGICDADFDHINGLAKSREAVGVCLTDLHDAEMMLIESTALQSFIDEYSSNNNHPELTDRLKDTVLSSAAALGRLRLINFDEDINLNFKGLNFLSFIDVDKLGVSVDLEQLLDDLIRRSSNIRAGVTKDHLADAYNNQVKADHPKTQLCCGHDATNIMAMIYSQKWASCTGNISKDKIESALRVGYTVDSFRQTKLFSSVVAAAKNLGFDIQGADVRTE